MPVTAQPFSIDAHTFIIKSLGDETNYRSLLKPGITYRIPIFQRPYSWAEKETAKLVNDLFMSYWGTDGDAVSEPMFIGTMQLSELQHSQELPSYYDVIDGQQRLTTLLILLKYFSLAYPGCFAGQEIGLDWLRTEVSNGVQQEELQVMLDVADLNGLFDGSINPFVRNLYIISQLTAELISSTGEGQPAMFCIAGFLKHLFTHLYFVVIVTRAGLTKTLQIFNAINTTGLDLNGSDIFKLRMFQYLKDRLTCRTENELFKEISALYERIEVYNRQCDDTILSFNEVLDVYQYILVQRLRLPVVLYEMGTDLFYINLFDTVSRAARPEHFTNLKDPALSCVDLHRIIDVMIAWNEAPYPTVEDACAFKFIEHSRYSKFSVFNYLFLYRYYGEADDWEMIFPFLREMSLLYWSYSIIFQRRVYHMDAWSYECLDHLIDQPYQDLMNFIRLKVVGKTQNDRVLKELVTETLEGAITFNYKTKTLICRLSGMLDEEYTSSSRELEIAVVDRLFSKVFDVEHIQSYQDKNEAERDRIKVAWGDELNAIGNLVAMESSINRSMHNDIYADKLLAYRGSEFPSIAKLMTNYPAWGLDFARDRKAAEITKIVGYVFNPK